MSTYAHHTTSPIDRPENRLRKLIAWLRKPRLDADPFGALMFDAMRPKPNTSALVGKMEDLTAALTRMTGNLNARQTERDQITAKLTEVNEALDQISPRSDKHTATVDDVIQRLDDWAVKQRTATLMLVEEAARRRRSETHGSNRRTSA